MEEMPEMSPVRLWVERGGRQFRDWRMAASGTWMLIRDASDEDAADSLMAYSRERDSVRQWAARHGHRAEIRRRESGRRIWVRLTRRDAR